MRHLAITALMTAALPVMGLQYDAATDGTTAGEGYTLAASGGALAVKTVAGYAGLGVATGPSGGEIDLGQRLIVQFDTPQWVSELTLAFLFDGPEYGDPNEKAVVQVGEGTTYILQATGEMDATWTGNGGGSAVANVSPAVHETLGGAAVWTISNPFYGMVSGFELYPESARIDAGNDSDFSLHSFRTGISTPDGGSTLVLLGMASLLGLAVTRRR